MPQGSTVHLVGTSGPSTTGPPSPSSATFTPPSPPAPVTLPGRSTRRPARCATGGRTGRRPGHRISMSAPDPHHRRRTPSRVLPPPHCRHAGTGILSVGGGREEEGAMPGGGVALREGDPSTVGGYRLSARLGCGGMGVVYLGQAADGAQVAVKVIVGERASDPEWRARFLREVDNARRVARFCTAPVLDAGVDGDRPYLVTQYVPGPTLAQVVREAGPLGGADLEGLAVGTAAALSAIHAAGLVHRDLKPSNVLMSPVGPRVIDFGIARYLGDATGPWTAQLAIGTPGYVAPELCTGGPVTAAADVFAWGGVIAFAGTGRPPFGNGEPHSMLYRVVHAEPDLDGLDTQLRPLVAAATAKDP